MAEASPAERVPPHSQEAELAVLGAVMLEPKAMSAVSTVLEPECFYRPDHQKLYRAFARLFDKNQPIDIVSVKEELRRQGDDDVAGNADLFMTLGGAVPSVANAEHYAGIVRAKSVLRSLIHACNESLIEAYQETQEARDVLDRAQERLFQIAKHRHTSEPIQVSKVVQEVVDTIMNHPERLVGIRTEYEDLDRLTGGLHRGEFIVIGGRPSTGKTTLAINLIEHIGVRQGHGVLMFSLEMAREQIAQNLLCCNAGMDSTPLRTGRLDRGQWETVREAASRLYDSPIYIDDSSSLTCGDVRNRCRQMFHDHPIELVIVDYLQLMSGERRGRNTTRLQEITDISRGLKALAKELNVPLIALSQLSRAAEGDASARPRLSHLRESGAIEQDADVVMLLHQVEPADPEGRDKNLTELIIAKQRNGPTDTIRLTFVKDQMRFGSWSAYQAAQVGVPEGEPQPF